jgi:P27 family predicted phage terminase small subunit
VHDLNGDPGKRRRYSTEPSASGAPVAPDYLDPIAAAEWISIVELLGEMDLLGGVDAKALALYCETFSRYRAAVDYVKQNGAYNDKGNPNGATKDIQVLANQMRAWLVEFGCTPAARARMRVAKTNKKPASKWSGKLKVI